LKVEQPELDADSTGSNLRTDWCSLAHSKSKSSQ
jgi:hypothetical protein